ncbi:hypothetical protein HELRODRAFT_171923 [Helobdella robusta]|uniref:Apple domain-containing protein n=1 Tax=Helobdella robusta TaxID=6412 RepID=T1F4V2_HELRO|nr:hypothetical protein HELRODRAFT_171923 [Helobdella robusta]ESO04921.1 hypothetical protein HELRODRAFT_171923 [Helobdella robusta]
MLVSFVLTTIIFLSSVSSSAAAIGSTYRMIGEPNKSTCFVSEPSTVITNIRSLLECSSKCSHHVSLVDNDTATCNAFNYISKNASDPAKYCQLFNFNCGFEFEMISNISNCQAYEANESTKGRVLTMTADNQLKEFYVNGNNISVDPTTFPNANKWNQPDTYNLTCRVIYTLAVKAWNNYIKGGFIANTADHYILTNSTWKCSMNYTENWYEIDFDDSLWPAAYYGKWQGDSKLKPPIKDAWEQYCYLKLVKLSFGKK